MTTTTRLPDLPGMTAGVVAVRDTPKGRVFTLQCERCHTTEEPAQLVLMGIHFHARSLEGPNPRLCRECRVAVYPDCKCDRCRQDRQAAS